MKSMTKLMVVAMILAAALVVAPVAAARDVYNGDVIYVGEDDLNLEGVFNASTGTAGTLVYYSSISDNAGTVGRTIRVANITDLDLTAAAVGSATGTSWYAFNSTITDFRNPGNAAGTVLIEDPSADLRVLLGNSGTTSIDGQSVTRANSIRFRIDHNLAGLRNGTSDPDNYSVMEVRVTTPSGGTVTNLGGEPLRLPLTTNQWVETKPIPLTGLALGTYTARAVWPSNSADLTDSNSVTFEITSGAVTIEADKDSVVRGNDFSVTITGESEQFYWVSVTTAGTNRPMVVPSQVGVEMLADGDTSALIKTTAGGSRTIAFNTSTSTDAKTYTIEVEGPAYRNGTLYANSKTESVKVRVEEGSVTITASGTGTYYVGEDITLSGTCTESETVYLFLTGPNLGSEGVRLIGTMGAVTNGDDGTFTTAEVEGDDTWSYTWETSRIDRALTSGGYTIYAVSEPRDRQHLGDAKYATTTVQLRPGFITATLSSANIARGEDVVITGTAQGNPAAGVNIWIFGKNFYGNPNGDVLARNENVESDGTFEFELDGSVTKDLTAGQYFVIVQHPMGSEFEVAQGSGSSINNIYRAGPEGDVTNTTDRVFVAELTRLQASEAANALIDALESPYVNDAYTKLTFFLEDAWIRIDPIGDQSAGSTFTITGTTNLAAGGELIVEVTSAAFQPGAAGETSGFSSDAGTVTIQQGETANTWSFEVDGTTFRPDQYTVTVESIETQTSTSTTFNIVEGPAPTPTGTETTTPTGTETTTPTGTTTTEPTPTQSPGFGALVALAGLGAVAFLVLRRD